MIEVLCFENVFKMSQRILSLLQNIFVHFLYFFPLHFFFLTVWEWMRTIHQIHHNFTAVFSPTWKPFFQQNYHFFKILDQPLKKKKESPSTIWKVFEIDM